MIVSIGLLTVAICICSWRIGELTKVLAEKHNGIGGGE
jgi:hypothetical protein